MVRIAADAGALGVGVAGAVRFLADAGVGTGLPWWRLGASPCLNSLMEFFVQATWSLSRSTGVPLLWPKGRLPCPRSLVLLGWPDALPLCPDGRAAHVSATGPIKQGVPDRGDEIRAATVGSGA